MKQRHVRTSEGNLRLLAWREVDLDPVQDLALKAARSGSTFGEMREFGELKVYFKAGPLRGESRLRHGLRALQQP